MKRQSRYIKIAIVSAVLIPVLSFANLFFLLPIYGAVNEADKSTVDKKLSSAESGIHVLRYLIFLAMATLAVSILLEFLRVRKKK